MPSPLNVRVYFSEVDFPVASRLVKALRHLKPDLRVWMTPVLQVQLLSDLETLDYAIVFGSGISSEFGDELLDVLLRANRGSILVETRSRVDPALLSQAHHVVDLNGWDGFGVDRRVLHLANLLTDDDSIEAWHSPARARLVLSVTVQGNQRIEPETVLAHAALRVGNVYDQEGIDGALRDLYATGLFDDVMIAGADTGNLVIQVREKRVAGRVGDGPPPPDPNLLLKVEGLPFSPRSRRAFKKDNIVYLGDVVQRTEAELLRIPDFGRKSLDEVKAVLRPYGLRLGIDIPNWPPGAMDRYARLADAAVLATGLRQAPLGATFEPRSDYLVINPAGDESDRGASERSLVDQMRVETLRKARKFGSLAPRMDNQIGWQGLGELSQRLVSLLDRSTSDVPDVLGTLYSAALELGSFYELDRALQRGEPGNAMPLDAEIRRPLDDLVRSLAPWLRQFPTIREIDDEAGQFLTPPPATAVSAAVVEAARETALITEGDVNELRTLIDASKRGEFQGAKAGRRGILSARNMVLAAVSLFGTLVLSDFGTKSVLVGKAGTFLAAGEAAILEIVADLPHDIRIVVETMVNENRTAPIPPAEPRPLPARGMRPPRGRMPDEEGAMAGELFAKDGIWYVRYDYGGAYVPLMVASFDIDRLDVTRAYPVYGHLITAEGRPYTAGGAPFGFSAYEVVVAAAGKA